MIEASNRVVVFTGAGISTESGIPDFRSPGGFWTKHQPIDFNEFMAQEEMRRESWRRELAREEAFAEAKPNRGHRAIAELYRRGKVSSVVTQNIDDLHQASGVPDGNVIELHGNRTYAACLECSRRYELGPILEAFRADGTLPVCDHCNGIVKTATISFGQSMPVREMQRAERETLECDLFMAIGSSLVVYPAAGFPGLAKERGAKLVILNRDSTHLDTSADLVLHEDIGPTLGAAVGVD
jgi:NAD-dependent deacetylase